MGFNFTQDAFEREYHHKNPLDVIIRHLCDFRKLFTRTYRKDDQYKFSKKKKFFRLEYFVCYYYAGDIGEISRLFSTKNY